jgi:hypothetical protein
MDAERLGRERDLADHCHGPSRRGTRLGCESGGNPQQLGSITGGDRELKAWKEDADNHSHAEHMFA